MKTKLLILLAVIASMCAVSCGSAKVKSASKAQKEYNKQKHAAETELRMLNVILTPEEKVFIVSMAQAEAFTAAARVGKEYGIDVTLFEERAAIARMKAILTAVPLDSEKSAYAQMYVKMCTYWAMLKIIRISIEIERGQMREYFGDIPEFSFY